MSRRKQLLLALSLLATGVSAAFFFRKEADRSTPGHEAKTDFTFQEQVQRRVDGSGGWTTTYSGRRAAKEQPPAQRVAAGTTVAISDGVPRPVDREPSYQKRFNPVGSLLEPIESIPNDEPGVVMLPPVELSADPTWVVPPLGVVIHKVVDGDTLSRLAVQYMGRSDRYLEIYEQNRDVLASPDLLPIGVTLRIDPSP